jgi:hypothetical protein
MEEAFVEFFSAHKSVFLTLHIMGVAVGMGGATIADMLFFNFLRDFSISKKESEVLETLSNAIMAALGVLWVSGAALYFSDPVGFAASPAFLVKMTILAVLTVNGILMHKFIAPHMVDFSFLRHPLHARHVMHTMRAVAFAMGAVSFTSWYSVFFIAMLKSYLPAGASYVHLLLAYAFIASFAVLSSQIIHTHIRRKSAS